MHSSCCWLLTNYCAVTGQRYVPRKASSSPAIGRDNKRDGVQTGNGKPSSGGHFHLHRLTRIGRGKQQTVSMGPSIFHPVSACLSFRHL
jgi:hypothetical protein